MSNEGQALRKALRDRERTATEFAEIIGKTRQTVQRLYHQDHLDQDVKEAARDFLGFDPFIDVSRGTFQMTFDTLGDVVKVLEDYIKRHPESLPVFEEILKSIRKSREAQS